MYRVNQLLRYAVLATTIAALWCTAEIRTALAAPTTPRRTRIRYKIALPPPTGNPTQTSGAGSRGQSGGCPAVDIPLTALVPTSIDSDFVWGRTLEARPTFWVYVPYALTPQLPAELRIKEQDAEGNSSNQTIVRITNAAPGVIGIRLPADKTLATNQLYYWSFVVLCDSNDASANQFVKAAIQRVAPKLATSLAPGQKAALYAESGLWYDAITQLGKMLHDRPQDTHTLEDWTTLLTDSGLHRIAPKAIVKTPQ
ncbi:DUF928 domain-containing protein [Phormidesmis priestleyi]